MTEQGGKPESRKWWKIFFWFHAIFTALLGVVMGLSFLVWLASISENSPSGDATILWNRISSDLDAFEMFITWPVILLTTIGIYGFAYRKKIFSAKFSRFFLVVFFAYFVYEIVTIDLSDIEPSDYSYLLLAMLFVLPFYALEYLALHNYSLKSPEIWERQQLGTPNPVETR